MLMRCQGHYYRSRDLALILISLDNIVGRLRLNRFEWQHFKTRLGRVQMSLSCTGQPGDNL
jgi:hypothetical protein